MLIYPSSTEGYVRREAGGKGLQLWRMSREGLPVPPWVAVPARTFHRFVEETGIGADVDRALSTFASGARSAEDVAGEVRRLIESAEVPAALREDIERAHGEIARGGDGLVAVRSSAADEDGARHSFAGQHASFLYVCGVEDAVRRVRTCWASGYSARALCYRRENALDPANVSIAVVLQAMVDPRSSGVLFTCDPVAGDASRFVVSSVWGVGEGLVSGELPADTFHLDAGSGAVQARDVVEKPAALRGGSSGECARTPVPADRRGVPSVDDGELAALHGLGRRLRAMGRRPQDVEWAIDGAGIWILQTRPVTSVVASPEGTPNLWDNSNIVESYGGLTSPLSFSFAKRNYHSVYVQFCEILGVPRSVIADMDETLRNMLGCIHGRVFYNLFHWYELVGILPGVDANRRFMETMMGVRDELPADVEERMLPHPWSGWRGKLRRLRIGLTFLGYHFRIQGIVDRFLASFREGWEYWRALDYQRMSSDEIWRKYLELDRAMIRQWKAPIVNDFLCMVHFGLLRRLTKNWFRDAGENLQNDLLAGDGSLESAQPTRELVRLAVEAERTPELRKLLEDTPAEDLPERLCQSEFRGFHDRIAEYVDRFGFRCMNEMKLEETDLSADPSYLFTCLKNYLRAGATSEAEHDDREQELRSRAEEYARSRLRGWKRAVYFRSLKHARRAVRNRENTRFCRTRIYGVVRAMFRAMGEDLCDRGVLERPEDVFFLTIEEIDGLHEGTLPSPSVAEFVAIRRRDYGRYETAEPRPRFLTRGLVYEGNDFLDREEIGGSQGGEEDLRGIACCPGVVEGVVKVVRSASDDLRLDGEILVAPRTDPGWVPLYPSVSGLLVERGSLLSHSAIVAREMGLPAIVGVSGLCRRLRSGMRVRMDGRAGTIEVLE